MRIKINWIKLIKSDTLKDHSFFALDTNGLNMCVLLFAKKNSRLEHYPYIYVYRALGQPLEIKLPRSTISERIDQIYIFGHLISFPIPNERSLSKSQFQKFPQWPGREREINDLQWDNEWEIHEKARPVG